MKIDQAIKYMISTGLTEDQIKSIVYAISMNELEAIKAPLWEKAATAKYALEADTYLQVINTIEERKKYHETNK